MIELVGRGREAKHIQPDLARRLPRGARQRPPGAKGQGRRGRPSSSPRATILDGTSRPGQIGGDSTAALIRQARAGREGQGDRPARRQRRRQRLRLRGDPPRARSSPGPPASRSSSRWARSPPRAATGSRPPPTRSGPAPTTITGSIGIFGDVPDLPEAAREVPRHARRRRRHHLAAPARCASTAPSTRGSARSIQQHDRPRLRGLPRPRRQGAQDEPRRRRQDRPRPRLERRRRQAPRPRRQARRPHRRDRRRAAKLAKLEGEPKVLWVEKEADWKQQLAAGILDASARFAHLGEASAPRGLSPPAGSPTWRARSRRTPSSTTRRGSSPPASARSAEAGAVRARPATGERGPAVLIGPYPSMKKRARPEEVAAAAMISGIDRVFSSLGRVVLCARSALARGARLARHRRPRRRRPRPSSPGCRSRSSSARELFGPAGSLRAALEAGERREGLAGVAAPAAADRPRRVSVTAAPLVDRRHDLCDPRASPTSSCCGRPRRRSSPAPSRRVDPLLAARRPLAGDAATLPARSRTSPRARPRSC